MQVSSRNPRPFRAVRKSIIAIGTSGVVYPAAGFCQVASSVGALCVEFNLEPSAVGSSFNYGLYGKASVTLPQFVDELIEKGTAKQSV